MKDTLFCCKHNIDILLRRNLFAFIEQDVESALECQRHSSCYICTLLLFTSLVRSPQEVLLIEIYLDTDQSKPQIKTVRPKQKLNSAARTWDRRHVTGMFCVKNLPVPGLDNRLSASQVAKQQVAPRALNICDF